MSSNSPTRGNLTQRTVYTHHHNSRPTERYDSKSQRSPLINSPRLNQETQIYEVTKKQFYSGDSELRTKLQIVLKHNSQLLNENAKLSEMVNSLRMQLDLQRKQTDRKTILIQQEMKNMTEQLQQGQDEHQKELARLMDEISHLHQQNLDFQMEKNKEIKRLKQMHEKQLSVHISQIKRSTTDKEEVQQLQLRKVKEQLELKDFEYQSLKTEYKSQLSRIKSENKSLLNQIQHLRKLKQIQIKEVMNEEKQRYRFLMKELEQQKQIQVLKRQSTIKKLRKQINHKTFEIEQARKEGSAETQDLYDELVSIRNDKVSLLEELEDVKEKTQEKYNQQKQFLTRMMQQQKENMQTIINTERTLFKEQRQKIILLCIEKTQQIKRLYEIVDEQKESFEKEKENLQSLIHEFKEKLKEVEASSTEELQLLKIKMAQLHEGDIKALESYYENQIRNALRENKIISEAHEADRAKLHKALQQNDDLRKNFQIQTSKQKAKLQDMKVKFAAANVQFKEQITSMGTKMQLTSQTLLRETQQKQKGAEFFETEKKKFYRIIEEKDKEIIAIQDTMSKLKQINDKEIEQLHSQINMLRDSLITKDQEFKEMKNNLEVQFERKSMKIIEEAEKIQPDQAIIQENSQLREKKDQLQKQIFKKTKEIQFLMRQNKSLQGELGLRAGFIETLQLESSAAIEDEKSKVKVLMNQSQVAMKDYYENKLSSKQKDIQGLKRQLTEKDYDLRALITKYNNLEKKLKQLLEAQNKLTEFQEKIASMGLDQSLIKSTAELFKKYNRKAQ